MYEIETKSIIRYTVLKMRISHYITKLHLGTLDPEMHSYYNLEVTTQNYVFTFLRLLQYTLKVLPRWRCTKSRQKELSLLDDYIINM